MNRHRYKVVKTHAIEFDELLFRQKATEVLDRYDLIVGDFSGGQLRLKGFFHENRKNIPIDQKSFSIPEYLAEYCAYGCPYYILEKLPPIKEPKLDLVEERPAK